MDFERDYSASEYPDEHRARAAMLVKEAAARINRYSLFWKWYNGNHWDFKRKDGDELVTVNFCRLFVNKGASFLMSNGWEIYDEEDQPYSDDIINYLNKLWKVNEKDFLSLVMAQGGGLFGDFGLAILPDLNGFPSINFIPPGFCFPEKHPANNNILLRAVIEQPLSLEKTLTSVLDPFYIRQYINNEKVNEIKHNIGEVPFVLGANRLESCSPYGTSDIAGIIPLNKLLNKKETEMSDIINYHSSPVTLFYGVKVKQMKKGARKMYSGLPSPKDAKVENLELKTDLAAAHKHAERILDYMFMIAEKPEIAFGRNLNISNTSGVAIKMMYQPLTDANNFKQVSYGRAIRDINRMGIKFGILNGYLHKPTFKTPLAKLEYFHTSVKWNNPLPMDDLIQLNMLINRLSSGTIQMKDFLSEMGVRNIQKYIAGLLQDAETGVNLFTAEKLANFRFQNIGGVVNSTSQQKSDLIKEESTGVQKSDHEQRKDAADRIKNREKEVRSTYK